jgi:hypothetical protein
MHILQIPLNPPLKKGEVEMEFFPHYSLTDYLR